MSEQEEFYDGMSAEEQKLLEQAGKLVCDNPECDYQQTEKEMLNESMVNRPCPKCGENLLTEEDYKLGMYTIRSLAFSQQILSSLNPPSDLDAMDKTEIFIKVGQGNLTIREGTDNDEHQEDSG